MATYKVLQDIEAEDKLLGPLTLKQFIFAAITIGLGFVCFLILGSPAPTLIKLPLITPILPVMLVFGFLAAPISRDQPNDIWLLARLRFLLKPHKRIWNQDGVSQLVTINAPKKQVQILTNGLSQTEVKSRLQALANTVDSRGWAVKNVNTNMFAQPGYLTDTESDRLINPSSLPQDVPIADVTAADDILDTTSNSTAQHLDQLVQQSTQNQRQQAISNMHTDQNTPQKPADYWFMQQSQAPQSQVPQDFAMFKSQQVVAPGGDDVAQAAQATEEEKLLADKLVHDKQEVREHITDHMKVLQPLHDRDGNIIQQPITPKPAIDQGQNTPSPAILGLAQNDDLNVATIARQAQKIDKDDNEVVISLH